MQQAEGQDPPKNSTWKRKILKVTVTLMFLVMSIGVIVIWTLHEGGGTILKVDGHFVFDIEEFILTVNRVQSTPVLVGKLGGDTYTTKDKDLDACNFPGDKYCYTSDNGPTLHVQIEKVNDVQCYIVHWENITSAFIPSDCYEMKKGSWFGLMSTVVPSADLWPIGDLHVSTRILHPGFNTFFGEIMDYYLVSTEGTSFYVVDNSPIKFTLGQMHSRKLCISPPLLTHVGETTSMKYGICQGSNIKDVHQGTRKQFNSPVLSYSNKSLSAVSQYVYSTSTGNISISDSLAELKQQLDDKNLTCGVLEVPIGWEAAMGDLVLGQQITAGLTNVATTLNAAGCKLLFTISPVCSYKSQNFISGMDGNYFLRNQETRAVYFFGYQDTQGALWDVRNEKVIGLLKQDLKKLTRELSIFEYSLLPLPNIEEENSAVVGKVGTRDMYNSWINLLRRVSQHSNWPVVSSTFRSQGEPSVIEVNFKKVNSSSSVCLSNSIPNALTIGLYGYPFLMSSVDITGTSDEDKELLTRWLQLAVFFPWIKIPFSLLQAGISTQQLFSLRESVFADLDKTRITDKLSVSYPLLQPMWWLAPTDAVTYNIGDQLLLGDMYLIAPVLCSGTRSRDVYLPKGDYSWTYNGQPKEAGWHRGLSAPIDEVLIFKKVDVQ